MKDVATPLAYDVFLGGLSNDAVAEFGNGRNNLAFYGMQYLRAQSELDLSSRVAGGDDDIGLQPKLVAPLKASTAVS